MYCRYGSSFSPQTLISQRNLLHTMLDRPFDLFGVKIPFRTDQ
jgi:hypothetical protein